MNELIGIDAGALPIRHAIMPRRHQEDVNSVGSAPAPRIAEAFQGLVKP
ncbi:MAG: hypothetical protein JSU00_10020 [Acidobacteria bacterium]|nr:hypothetical protein [Acidobacteriota bacterium]